MKNLHRVCFSLLLLFALSATAFAGNAESPGITGPQESPGITGTAESPGFMGDILIPGFTAIAGILLGD